MVLSGRDEVRGEQVVKDIRAAGGQAYFVRADLHDEASARALAARAKERVGPIDVLVNSAGIYPFGPTSTEGTAGMGEDLNALAGAAPAPPPQEIADSIVFLVSQRSRAPRATRWTSHEHGTGAVRDCRLGHTGRTVEMR